MTEAFRPLHDKSNKLSEIENKNIIKFIEQNNCVVSKK